MADTGIDQRPAVDFRRTYSAPPERVWQAWTDPEALKQWFSPDPTGVVELADLDVRVGGHFRIRVRTSDDVHDVSGIYQEVDPPRRLVFTWAWKSTPERVSLVSVQIAPIAEGTQLHFRHEQFFDEKARDDHSKGWTVVFARLAHFIDGR